jgi:TM2 domain-containing membrane protein YozV
MGNNTIMKHLVWLLLLVSAASAQDTPAVFELKNGEKIRSEWIPPESKDWIGVRPAGQPISFMRAEEVSRITLLDGGNRFKSPEAALAHSILFPGLGQYYNGDALKGLLIEAGVGFGFFLILAEYIGDVPDPDHSTGKAGGILMGTAYLYSLIDAPATATEKNRKKRAVPNGKLLASAPEGYRNPTAACLFSLFPGGGQHYNGQSGKGILQMVLVFDGLVVMDGNWASRNLYAKVDNGLGLGYMVDGPQIGTEKTTWFYVGLGVMAGAWAWSLVDAPLQAKRINRRCGFTKGDAAITPQPQGWEFHFDPLAFNATGTPGWRASVSF